MEYTITSEITVEGFDFQYTVFQPDLSTGIRDPVTYQLDPPGKIYWTVSLSELSVDDLIQGGN